MAWSDMACAQCHDHKYDPITQHDYYSLMDAFNRVPETGRPNRISSRIRVAEPYLELPLEKEDAEELAKRRKEAKDLEAKAKPYLEGAYEGWFVSTIKAGKLPEERNGLNNEVVVLLQKPEAERSPMTRKRSMPDCEPSLTAKFVPRSLSVYRLSKRAIAMPRN